MNISELIDHLMEERISLRVTPDEQLRVVFPDDYVPGEQLITRLKQYKKDLIAYLREDALPEPVPVQETQEYYPCSPAQRRLWILEQFLEGNSAYTVSVSYQFRGRIDVAAFEKALDALVQRHESLRTVFGVVNEQPVQRILHSVRDHFFYKNLCGMQEARQLAIQEMGAMNSLPFNMEKGPLFRAGLWQTGDAGYCFLLCMHHIISDGWSVEILMHDLIVLYRQQLEKGSIHDTPLPIQYKEYTLWLARQSASGKMSRSREYWLQQLAGDLPVLELPSDFSRPQVQTFNGSLYEYTFPAETVAKFRGMLQQNGSTMFMGVMAVLKALICRYTGQHDIIIGTPVAGRPHKAFEQQVGFYVNTVALRTTATPGGTFLQLLEAVKENTVAAYEHQLYPFDTLVDELNVTRDTSHSPVFDVLLSLQSGSYLNHTLSGIPGITATPVSFAHTTSQFDWSFDFTDHDETLNVCVEYNTDLFTPERITRVMEHFQSIMHLVAAQPGIAIKDMDFLPLPEKQLLLYEYNRQHAGYDCEQTLHTLFEAQAAKYPGRVAVIHGAQQLSFRQLNEAANQLAHLLLQQGIAKGQFVAVHLERGAGLAIAMMGILKSGGAYLPVDPLNPLARVQTILADSRPFAFITDDVEMATQEATYAQLNLPVLVCMGEAGRSKPVIQKNRYIAGEPELAAMPVTNPGLNISPTDWCYMLYTSGSTSKPKGAILRHNGSVNHILAEFQELQLEDGFRFLQSANIASDISVWQYLAPWLRGGACVVIGREDLQLYDRLMNILQQEAVTIVEFVPSYLAALISFLEAYPSARLPLPALKWMMVVGEEVTTDVVQRWQRLYPDTGVLNGYGPAEASDDITQYIVTGNNLPGIKVPIGKPLPNLNIFLLDKNKQLAPLGCRGEIAVSGVGVGAGYWELPEKTKEVFIPNPFPGTLGDTIYCTGDQGIWLPGGNLEFLGRIDEQVKIRGFRVELAEIESVLRELPLVKDAAVDNRRMASGEKRLVAYLLKEQDEINDETFIRQVKAYAAQHLADHMVPVQYMVMERFPINLSDKVDKKRLPEPPQATTDEDYTAPENITEEKLLAIWKQVLGNNTLGVHANFFEHGGQSVKAIQIVSRVYRDMNVRAELKDVFLYPTVKKLAAKIGEQVPGRPAPITKAPPAAHYPLSNAQLRIWIAEKMYPGGMAYNMPMKYRFHGVFHEAAFREAVTVLVHRHEILRTAFIEINGEPRQRVLPAGNDTSMITVTDLRGAGEETIAKNAEALLWRSFNLEAGCLFRVEMIRTADEEYLLFLVFHHIISDGWSEDIFLDELVLLYDACCKKTNRQLPPLAVQYCDYAVWQQQFLQSEAAEKQKTYWLDQFRQPAPLLQLPVDYARTGKKSFEAIDFRLTISEAVSAELKKMVLQHGASNYMLLLATLYIWLHRFTQQTDIVIGSPVAGRNHTELENQLGCYMNTLALRQQFDTGITFSALLQQVKENTLEAFGCQEYPFDLLVSELKPPRVQGRLPLFDAGFTWLNTGYQQETQPVHEQPGYTVTAYTEGSRTVKTDCWVHAWEAENGQLGIYLSLNKDLFSQSTATALSDALLQLVNRLPSSAGETISSISAQIAAGQKTTSIMERNETKKKNLEKFFRAPVSAAKDIVKTSELRGGHSAIRVVEATVAGASLPKWMNDNRALVDEWLLQYGGILFRGFNANNTNWSQQIADAFSGQQVRYFDQTSPRSAVTGSLYTSTEHPADQVIHMHNELSYSFQWPLHIMFSCIIPAQEYGETPLADTRQVWAALSEATKKQFLEKGVMYVRNMRNSMGLSWQQVFQTTDKQEVETHFAKNGIQFKWIGEDHLRTQWVRPAVQVHPVSGEQTWFNHCFFYNEHLMDEAMRKVLSAGGELPFNTYYGTGEPVQKETIEEIAAAFEANKIMFPWQKGDLVLLDNLLMAHGRNHFTGERKILVSMFNPQLS